MTLIFLGWAVWAACNWSHLLLVQKVVMGLYAPDCARIRGRL